VPPPAPQEDRRWPWPIIALAGAALLLVVAMIAAFARWGGSADAPQRVSPAHTATHTASPSLATSPATSPAPASPTVSAQPSTPQTAAAALIAIAQSLQSSGAIDQHLSKEIERSIRDLLDHLDEPDEVAATVDDLRNEVADSIDKGKATPEAAQQLSVAIDQLAKTLPSSGGEGD
jgi:hypothetical protein